MADYIKREDVLKILNKKLMTKDIAIGEIKNLPTADVEEVKHGYWIVVGRTEHRKSILKCSHCGRVRKNHGKSSFCCDCGAKMDGGNAE